MRGLALIPEHRDGMGGETNEPVDLLHGCLF
jgi:hypothetical protein